ncbi:MAG: TonB-dependent receptor, partial [Candidatus Latescibacterota bacterium]|nr:TonB-dependent receptor [Candidatus Latescibacterota bacterium]
VRLAWTPNASNTFWAAASKANRAPARGDHDLRALGTVSVFDTGARSDTVVTVLRGSSKFENEVARSVELGYRTQLGTRWRLDMAAYRTEYDGLHTNELVTPEFDQQLG